MRVLANGSNDDMPVVSGESGVAGLAGLTHLVRNPELRLKTGLDVKSKFC